jgi:hypothetical protein
LFAVPGSLVRRCNVVEVMMPIFSREALRLCWDSFPKCYSAWGLDSVWPLLLRGRPRAIVDAVVAKHLRPVRSQHRRMPNGKTPDEENTMILREYGMRTHQDGMRWDTVRRILPMAKYLIGLLSAWKYADRRALCRATWVPRLRALGHDVVFLLGQPDIPAPERHGDLLILPCPGDYPTLPQRTRWFCRWALAALQRGDDWTHLAKADDDTCVCAERLSAYEPIGPYVGNEWKPGVGYGSGGGMYLLDRPAAAIAAEKLTQPTGAEDLLVGQVLRQNGIRLEIDQRFVPFGNSERRPKPTNDLITCHKVGPDVFHACQKECS